MSANHSELVRVLHVITRLIVGGAQENTMYTAAGLDPARFAVAVVSGGQTGSEGSLIDELRGRGVKLTILPELVRQVSPLRDLLAVFKLRRLMRDGGYQIVHTHSSKAGIVGRLAAKLAGCAVIIHTVHGWSFHDHMPKLTRRVYILLERWMARITDCLIVVSEQDIEKGLRQGIGRWEQYQLVRSAVPLDEFDPRGLDKAAIRRELGLPLDAPVVGNVGRFSPQKNPLAWVRVAGRISRQMPEARFLLVGAGPLQREVELALAQEGIAGRTRLCGLRRDVARMMGAMDVFLLTSLWEGLPRVIPQALAMSVPVVAYRTDGVVEAVRNGLNGYLCPQGDLEGMAERCLELLRDDANRARMGAYGHESVKADFDLGVMIRQIEEIYTGLLQNSNGGLNPGERSPLD